MLCCLFSSLWAQNPADSLLNDTIPGRLSGVDSLRTDSFDLDTMQLGKQDFEISDDALDDIVDYDAKDSMVYDIKNKKVHLYGDAEVNYTTINLKAGYIVFDWEANLVTAEEFPDSSGQKSGTPEFTDQGENFKAKKIKYNFKSRKGIIYEAVTTQNDLYVRSEVGKFVASNPSGDSTARNDVIYSKNAIFTSCDAEQPHYGIRSKKQKVVPNKTVVVGPSNLEISGIPTPLYLPFGFFPITSKARAGLVFPQDYEFDPRYGFGLSQVGFFTPLGDYANLQLTGDIYFKKRWGVNLSSSYKKKYKFTGRLGINYGEIPEELSDGSTNKRRSFRFTWNHNQDPSAHPTINFGGNVNIQTNNYDRAFQNDAQSVLNNTLNSGLNFSYRPKDKPYNFTASFDHSQNNQSRQVTFNFPNLNFQTQRIYPFKSKTPTGKEQWYEKLGFTYRANAKNRYSDTDSTLFSGNWVDRMQYGAQHDVNADVTFNVLKYFRVSPRVSYGETYYFQQLDKTFDNSTQIDSVGIIYSDDSTDFQIIYDTTYGQQVLDTLDAFKPYREFSTGVNLNFDLFGTMLFKKGWLRGLRHYAKPNISFNYAPDYRNPALGYIDSVDTDNRAAFNEPEEYNRFLGGVYSRPNIRGQQATIGFGVNNIFQAKYFSKQDSTLKYFNLADEFSLNGSYNMVADSLNWSQINVRLRGNWFKNFLNITIAARFDPYVADENGRRTNTFAWDKYKRPLEFVQASLPVSNTITIGKIRGWFSKEDGPEEENEQEKNNQPRPDNLQDATATGDFLSLLDNFSFSHNIVFDLSRLDGKDTFRITTNSLRMRGSLQLTKNWRVSINNISYDLVSKRLVYPEFAIYRDLHCWEMGVAWQPQRGTYNFYLRVKPGTLGFIEVPYQRRNLGQFQGF